VGAVIGAAIGPLLIDPAQPHHGSAAGANR
jgi:hypothetical protein